MRISEEKHRVLAEAANDAIISIGEDSQITYVNPATERIFDPDNLAAFIKVDPQGLAATVGDLLEAALVIVGEGELVAVSIVNAREKTSLIENFLTAGFGGSVIAGSGFR